VLAMSGTAPPALTRESPGCEAGPPPLVPAADPMDGATSLSRVFDWQATTLQATNMTPARHLETWPSCEVEHASRPCIEDLPIGEAVESTVNLSRHAGDVISVSQSIQPSRAPEPACDMARQVRKRDALQMPPIQPVLRGCLPEGFARCRFRR
jgi:hypothetical protein